jgi:hypothetical protein
MTGNSPRIGSRQGAEILQTGSVANGDVSGLKNAVSGCNLRLTGVSIWRI